MADTFWNRDTPSVADGDIASAYLPVRVAGSPGTPDNFAQYPLPGLIGFSQDGNYPDGSVGEALQGMMRVTDAPFGAKGNGIADDSSAVQAMCDRGGAFFIPFGMILRTTRPILAGQKGVIFYGPGCMIYRDLQETTANVRGLGSWFHFDHPGKGFVIDGTSGTSDGLSVVRFNGCGSFRSQPTPGVGAFTPGSFDYDFQLSDVDFQMDDFVCLNPTKFMDATQLGRGGRLRLINVRGQPLLDGIRIDNAYDICHLDVDFWNYWSLNQNVINYTLANFYALVTGRIDGLNIKYFFAIWAFVGWYAGNFGSGPLNRAHGEKVYFDLCTHGFVGDALADSMTIKLDHFIATGVSGSSLTSSGFENASDDYYFDIDFIDLGNHRNSSMYLNAATSGQMRVGMARFQNWGIGDASTAAIYCDTGNTIYFGSPTQWQPGNSTVQTVGGGAVSFTDISMRRPTPELYGAIANDPTIDNTAALNRFFVAAAAGVRSELWGTYYFKSALTIPQSNDIDIGGRSTLVYNGTSATIDLITVGSMSAQTIRTRITGLRIASLTPMTSGWAIRLNKCVRTTFRDFLIDGQDGNGNLFNGIWFNGCDVNILDGFQLQGAGILLRYNDGSDLFLDQGKISNADAAASGRNPEIGLNQAGGFGGVSVGAVDIIGCNINAVLDNSVSALPNREMTFSSAAALDSSKVGPNLHLNETSGAPVYIASAAWFASAATHNILIENTSSAHELVFTGGRIYNAFTGDGVRNLSPLTIATFTGIQINQNAGYGINNPTTATITTWGCTWDPPNALGDVNGVVMDPIRAAVRTIANGANASFPGQAGLITVTAADIGLKTATYLFGGGEVYLLGGSTVWVSPTTTPAAGKLSVSFASGSYQIYNNYGSTIRVQAVVNRTV